MKCGRPLQKNWSLRKNHFCLALTLYLFLQLNSRARAQNIVIQAPASQLLTLSGEAAQPKLEKIEETVARVSTSFYENKLANGDVLLIQKSSYSDGKMVEFVASVWLSEPLPIEIILLDDFIPSTQRKVYLKNKTTGEEKILSLQNNNKSLSEIKSLGKVTIRSGNQKVKVEEFLASDQMRYEAPKCQDNELRALARLRTADAASGLGLNAQNTRYQAQEPYFSRGMIVCLAFEKVIF